MKPSSTSLLADTNKKPKPFLKWHQSAGLVVYPLVLLLSFVYARTGLSQGSYFSNKYNILNIYFVKAGWIWITTLYFNYLYTVMTNRMKNTKYLKGSIVRYGLITLYWYSLTQWFFGPSMLDRFYVWTRESNWVGDCDISGHYILLVLSSLFLWEELSWIFYDVKPFEMMKVKDRAQYWSVVFVTSLNGFWLFMFFNIGVHFHAVSEILSGVVLAYAGWAVLYLVVFPNIAAIDTPSVRLNL